MKTKLFASLLAAAAISTSGTRAADCACETARPGPSEHPGSLPVLLCTDAVSKELKLTSAQATSLGAIRSAFRSSARRLTAQAPSTPAARRAAAEKLAALKSNADAEALAVLTPAQRSRIGQIEHRVLGGTMLLSPSVQKKLQLTPAQTAKISALKQSGEDFTAAVNKRFENGEISHHDRLATLRANRIKLAGAMTKILSPAQRQTLKSLAGVPAAAK